MKPLFKCVLWALFSATVHATPTFYYAVKSLDANTNESAYSNEAVWSGPGLLTWSNDTRTVYNRFYWGTESHVYRHYVEFPATNIVDVSGLFTNNDGFGSQAQSISTSVSTNIFRYYIAYAYSTNLTDWSTNSFKVYDVTNPCNPSAFFRPLGGRLEILNATN